MKETEEEIITDTNNMEGNDTKNQLMEFLNSNFLGVSILASTIILSGTLVFVFGPGVGSSSSVLTQPAAVVPTAVSDQENQAVGAKSRAPEIGDAPILGDPGAPVTIVEFSDYECPFCGRFFSESLNRVKSEYIASGKVKFVYKDFPLTSIHPQAQKAAESARCVREQLGDNGYWAMHDTIFENQQLLGVQSFKQWARQLGADGTQFDNCLDSDKYASLVQGDAAEGTALGVNGTPTFFVNDVMVVGAVPFEQIAGVIEGELEDTN